MEKEYKVKPSKNYIKRLKKRLDGMGIKELKELHTCVRNNPIEYVPFLDVALSEKIKEMS